MNHRIHQERPDFAPLNSPLWMENRRRKNELPFLAKAIVVILLAIGIAMGIRACRSIKEYPHFQNQPDAIPMRYETEPEALPETIRI